MSCDGCKELAEVKQLLLEVKGLLPEIKNQEPDLSGYLKKDELAEECANQMEEVVSAILPADAWPPLDPIEINFQDNIQITE